MACIANERRASNGSPDSQADGLMNRSFGMRTSINPKRAGRHLTNSWLTGPELPPGMPGWHTPGLTGMDRVRLSWNHFSRGTQTPCRTGAHIPCNSFLVGVCRCPAH